MINKITNGHPDSQSPDFVTENIQTLKQLFPTIVKEGKIDLEELKALLGQELETDEEYYRFTWAGKSMARREANKPSTATLRPDKESSKDWDTTGNIFIEGDNLEALKLLQKSYANKIKMIYIDPPYNTGKDFVYKDNYNDNLGNYLAITGQLDDEGKKNNTNSESDGRFHSNWLNMIYPRLKLARHLLKDDGIIALSIDDNELHNLKKNCDEIFGEDCYMGQISRATGTPTGGGNDAIVNKVDYVLIYSKTGENIIQGLSMSEDEMKIYDKLDDKGQYLIRSLRRTGGEDRRSDRPSMYFPIYSPDKTPIYPIGPTGYESRWICGKNKVVELEEQGFLEFKKVKDEWQVYQKFYLEGRLKQPSNLWDNIEGNKKATRDLKSLFEEKKVFDFPKPLELIQNLIQLAPKGNNDLILDFFAGSGTTSHAVMKLNAEDGGNRKCISVQLPEQTDESTEAYKAGYKKISDITKERIRRAGEKIKAEQKEDLFSKEGKTLDIGFRAFKLDSSNLKAWDGNPENLAENLFNASSNIKENRTEEDVLYEILLKFGLDLTQPIEEKTIAGKTVHNIGAGSLFICLADNLNTAVAEGIGKWKQEINPFTTKVIFKDNGFTDVEKTNSMQILKRFGIDEINTI